MNVPADPALTELLAAADKAEAAYAADPGSHTLPPYVQAWDRVLLALDVGTDPGVQAAAAHRGAVAHLQVLRHYGDDDHALIAIDLLTRLRRHAPSTPLRVAAVADLATVRFERYLVRGGMGLLRAAVAAQEEALRLALLDFEYRPALLANLGNALVELSRRRARAELLDRAVDVHEEAVATAPDAPYRPALLVNLATALLARYQRDGRVADLERAERMHRDASLMSAEGAQVVVARCDVRWERYALTADRSVLDEIVTDLRALVAELPEDVPAFATAAGNLANALLERQTRSADRSEALQLLDRAVGHVGAGSPERARLVHVRGTAYWQEYLRTGDLSRLSSAIAAWEEAAGELGRDDAAWPGYLNSLAVGLLQRDAHIPAEADLRAAVTFARRALRRAPPRSAVAPVVWNTLGHALLRRHDRHGRRRDLDAAVDAWSRAVALTPPDAATRPSYLAGRANGLRERAARSRGGAATADLVAAVALHREAIAALEDSRELPGQLVNLGLTLHGLAVHTDDAQRYREASDVFARAVALGQQLSPGEALRAGRAWLAMATSRDRDWPDVAAAGDGVLHALWTLLAAQLFRTGKEAWLRTSVDVAADTALGHRMTGNPVGAVAALESGRALLLSERLPALGHLQVARPDLALRYTAAATALAEMTGDRRGSVPLPAGSPIRLG